MKNRITLLRDKMQAKGYAGFLVTKPQNVRWLSGYTGSDNFSLLITKKDKFFFAYVSSIDQVKEQAKGFKVVDISKDAKQAVSNAFKSFRGKKLGFEKSITYGQLSFFKRQDKNNHRHYKSNQFFIEELRQVKNESEVKAISKAAKLVDEASDFIRRSLRVGIKEKELEWMLEKYLRNNGADERSFKFVIGFGPNSARGHHEATTRRLRANDVVLTDYGVMVDGYASDITRTFFFGKPDKKMADIYQRVYKSHQASLKVIKPGVKAYKLHEIAKQVIEKDKKYEFVHALGHGIGLEIHELPVISKKKRPESRVELKENMVFTVEPGIYVTGRGGVRLEDDLVVTKKGYKLLTKSSIKLEDNILPIKK